MANGKSNNKSLESWIWDAACSIRGAKDAPKYKEFNRATNAPNGPRRRKKKGGRAT